jgi:hypothetical protein
MRHIKLGESTVMQEFERIAAASGWIPSTEEQRKLAEVTVTQNIDKMMEGTKEPDLGYPENLVRDIQRILAGLGSRFRQIMMTNKAPDGVDGVWGAKTLQALREAAMTFSLSELLPLLHNLTAQQPGSQILLNVLSILEKKRAATPAPAAAKEAPLPTSGLPESPVKEPINMLERRKQVIQSLMTKFQGDKDLAESEAKRLYPQLFADDGMATASAIMGELIALANDLDTMGETKIAEAVDKELSLYKKAVDKLYDITGETGEQLIGEAHPGGGPTMVPSKDEGGKVETIVEEQKKMLKVVNTQPSGKQAIFVVQQLVALANRLDTAGKTEAALLVDKTIDELREGSQRPFVGNGLRREAIAPPLVIGVGIGITALVQLMLSRQENLDEDLGDYLTVLDKLASDDAKWKPYTDGLRQALEPYRTMFKLPPPKEDKARKVYRMKLQEFGDKVLPQLEQITRSIPRGWWTLGFGKGFRIRDKMADIKESYKEILNILDKADSIVASNNITKTPLPQAGKPEAALRTNDDKENQAVLDAFVGTVNKLIAVLVNPAKQSEIQKLFGGQANVEKALIGLDKLSKETKKPKSVVERYMLQQRNVKLWNYYMKALKTRKLASIERIAIPASGVEGLPPLGTTVKPKVPQGVRRPVRKPRPELQRLQQLMLALNLPLGRQQADGIWGAYTANAWNMLDHKAGGRLGAAPSEKTEGPPANLIDRAMRLANVLMRHGAAIDIAPGISIPSGAFASVQAFLRALSTKRGSGIDVSGNLDTAANRKRALELLRNFASRIDEDDTQLDLADKLGDQGSQQLIRQVNSLLDALSAADAGIPSYRVPSGSAGQQQGQQQGRQQGSSNVGNFGTLEGGPGKAGRDERTPTSMSLADQVYNVPDVSGFVNDPMQFATFARRYWMKYNEEEARKGDAYAIAHKVVDHLRRYIAVLQNRVMTATVRDRDSLQNTLRQRHEALNDVYTTLPKGR